MTQADEDGTGVNLETSDGLAPIQRVVSEMHHLSPSYLVWLCLDGEDEEPLVPPAMKERIRSLAEEFEGAVDAWLGAGLE